MIEKDDDPDLEYGERRQGGSPFDPLETLRRRRWCLLAPLFVCGLAGFAVAHLLPLLYKSTAFIIVEQQKIPEQYVTPNVLMTLQRRLDSMTQQILSRTRLQRFIEDFNLYGAERRREPMDDVIDTMRGRVAVELVQTPGRQAEMIGFRIHFSDIDRYRAQQVTNELTSLFIELDSRERTEQSHRTTAFLESQLQEAQKALSGEEENVRAYKMEHLGELPEQQQSNLQLLSSLEAQLQASTAALDRTEQQQAYLESMRAQQDVVSSLAKPDPETPAPAAGYAAQNSLALAESALGNLWSQLHEAAGRLTDRHPDVIAIKKEIADWEASVRRLKAERTASSDTASRLKAIQIEIANEKRESASLRERIGQVQLRLGQTPVREAELAELTRRHDNAKMHFQSLLEKKLGSELASNLEERQAGEQFRLLDPASLPKRPEGRSKVVGIGWVLGAVAGAALIALREWMDRTVRRAADLAAYRHVPVLARIPTMRSAGEDKRRRRGLRLEAAAIALMILLSLGTGAHVYLRG